MRERETMRSGDDDAISARAAFDPESSAFADLQDSGRQLICWAHGSVLRSAHAMPWGAWGCCGRSQPGRRPEGRGGLKPNNERQIKVPDAVIGQKLAVRREPPDIATGRIVNGRRVAGRRLACHRKPDEADADQRSRSERRDDARPPLRR